MQKPGILTPQQTVQLEKAKPLPARASCGEIASGRATCPGHLFRGYAPRHGQGLAPRDRKLGHPQINESPERFSRATLDEFLGIPCRATFYESLEALQTDLGAWLVYYNTERPHQG